MGKMLKTKWPVRIPFHVCQEHTFGGEMEEGQIWKNIESKKLQSIVMIRCWEGEKEDGSWLSHLGY